MRAADLSIADPQACERTFLPLLLLWEWAHRLDTSGDTRVYTCIIPPTSIPCLQLRPSGFDPVLAMYTIKFVVLLPSPTPQLRKLTP